MAQYTVTHTCGHEETHQIYGTDSHGERKAKAAWLAKGLCGACYTAQKREEEREAAEAIEAKVELPELVGSEKQIAWAKCIRAKIVGQDFPEIDFRYKQAMVETDARWFIENRW